LSEEHAIGVTIAGLGQTGALWPAIQTLRLSTIKKTIGTTQYLPALAEWPRVIRTEVTPDEGMTTQGTIDFTVSGLDYPDIAQRQIGHGVLRFFWGLRKRHDLILTDGSVNDSDVLIDFDITVGGTEPAVNDILYIGREAMHILTVTPVGDTRTLFVTRGIFGTVAEAHTGADPYGFVGVNNLPIDREVWVYLLNLVTDVETLIWRGLVENFELVNGGIDLVIQCRDALSYISERKLGTDRFVARGVARRGESSAPETLDLRQPGRATGPELDYKPVYAENSLIGTQVGKMMACIIDDEVAALVRMTVVGLGVPGKPWAYQHNMVGGAALEFDGQRLDVDSEAKDVQIREIMIADADNAASLVRDGSGVLTDHPADIIRNILASTGTATWPTLGAHTVGTNGFYDWLPKPWGLSVPDALIDHDAFDALVHGWPTSPLRAQSFYIGADRQEPKASEVIFDLAKALNAYIYLTPDAKISIKLLGDPGPLGVDATISGDTISGLEGAETGGASSPLEVRPVSSIQIELAQQGPGGKPAEILAAGDVRQTAASRYRHLARKDIIEATRIYGDPVDYSVAWFLREILGALFVWRYHYLNGILPVYELTTTPDAPRISAGQWISLTHPSFFETDGTRGIEGHRCLVMAADFSIETHEQKIRIVDFKAIADADEGLAPSWRAKVITSTTVFTIWGGWFTDDDTATWENTGSYRYDLWGSQGNLRSTDGPQHGNIAGSTVTMTAPWTSGAVPVLPASGDIIRVTTYDVSKSDASWTEDELTWISGGDGKLGAASDPGSNWDV
jgi:hypothetical protein